MDARKKNETGNLADLFEPPAKCEVCHKEKPDIRYADIFRKWICSDCMHVKAFSVEEEGF